LVLICEDFLRTNDSEAGDKVRIIQDQGRKEFQEGIGFVKNGHAGEDLARYIRLHDFKMPILVATNKGGIDRMTYVNTIENAGSTVDRTLVHEYIAGLAGKNGGMRWKGFNAKVR